MDDNFPLNRRTEAVPAPRTWLMVRRSPGWAQGIFAMALVGFLAPAWTGLAQVTSAGRGKNFVAPVTDAEGRRSVIRGAEARPLGNGLMDITRMQIQTYRGQEKDMLVEAPKCVFDTRSN